MDCFTLLKQDHDEATQLMKQCQSAKTDEKREEAFKQLARSVAVHAKLEETLFYPRFREEKELSAIVEEAYEEHQAVEDLLEEMVDMSPDEEEWEEKLQELQENIEHHVKEEESEFFPMASKVLSKEEAAELGQALADEKREMMKGSHRAAKEVFTRLGL